MTASRPEHADRPAPIAPAHAAALALVFEFAGIAEAVTRWWLDVGNDPELLANTTVVALLNLRIRGPLRPTQLRLETGLTAGGLSALLERLEAAGLVSRVAGPVDGDRRATSIILTDAGRAAAHQHAQGVIDTRDAIVAGLTRMLGLVDEAEEVGPRALPDAACGDPLEAAMRYQLAMARLGHQLLTIFRGEADGELVDNLSSIVVAQLYLHGPMRPGQLRRATGMTTGGTTKLLDRVEQAGLITRVLGPVGGDRRAVSIVLTSRGRRFAALLADGVVSHMAVLRPAVALALVEALQAGAGRG